MRQFRISFTGAGGILHRGRYVMAYAARDYSVRTTYVTGTCWWPYLFDIDAGPKTVRGKAATLDYEAPARTRTSGTGDIVPLGDDSYAGGAGDVHYLRPSARQRIDGRGVHRCSTFGPDSRQWMIRVMRQPPQRSLCVRGPRGGLYVKPLGRKNKSVTPDPGRVDKNVIARGETDGSMTVCEGVDGPEASTSVARLTNYPKRNEKREPKELLIPAMDWAEGRKAGVNYHEVTDFEFSPDRRLLAVASYEEFGVQHLDLHDFDGTKLTHKARYDFPARLVSFSPDGLTLAMFGHDQDDDGTEYPDTYLTLMDLEI